jgi:hypothetical protein
MKPLACHINWNGQLGPEVQILVDKMPDHKELRYRTKDGIYLAEKDGYVSFYYWVKPDNGFGGREFPLTMEDGTTRTLIGPWSSNPTSVRQIMGFDSIDVSLVDDPESFMRGYTLFSAHVTPEFFLEALRMSPTRARVVVKYTDKFGYSLKRTGHKKEDKFIPREPYRRKPCVFKYDDDDNRIIKKRKKKASSTLGKRLIDIGGYNGQGHSPMG